MNHTNLWVEALQIPFQQFLQWKQSTPTGESVIFWCLKNTKVPSEEYLNWAQKNYQLPLISNDFFDDKPNFQLWEEVKSVSNWSPEMLPLQIWDGVLYIGCVEPFDTSTWTIPVQLILAPAQGLIRYWEHLQHRDLDSDDEEPLFLPQEEAEVATEEEEQGQADLNIKDKIDSSATDQFSETNDTSELQFQTEALQLEPLESVKISLTNEPDSTADSPIENSKVKTETGNEGELDMEDLLIEVDVPKTQDDTLSTSSLIGEDSEQLLPPLPQDIVEAPDQVPKPQTNDTQSLEGNIAPKEETSDLTFTRTTSVKVESTTTSENPKHSPDPPPPVDVPTSIFIPGDRPGANNPDCITDSGSVKDLDLTQPIEPISPIPQDQISETADSSEPTVSSPADKQEISSSVVATDIRLQSSLPLSPPSLEAAKTIDEVVANLFQDIRKHYEKVMILTSGDKGYTPWKWDHLWRPVGIFALDEIPHDAASAFRITHRTQKPYHGRVSSSPINNSFFRSWGDASLPDCLTLYPVPRDLGSDFILLCSGNEDCQNKKALDWITECIPKYIDLLDSQMAEAA